MNQSEFEPFDAQPEWRALLQAYAAAHLSAANTEWLPRQFSVENVARENLSSVHGKLVAYGFLKVDLAPNGDGVVYQVTTLGRQALVPVEQRTLQLEAAIEAA